MRSRFDPWPHSVCQGSSVAVSCSIGQRCSLDLALLWLVLGWSYSSNSTPSLGTSYAMGVALKIKKKKKITYLIMEVFIFFIYLFICILCCDKLPLYVFCPCVLKLSIFFWFEGILYTLKKMFFFLWLHVWHMEVPMLEVGSELHQGPTPQPRQQWIQATSVTCATACSSVGSLTQWMRPGIEPASSWCLCWVLNPLSHNGNSTFLNFYFLLKYSWFTNHVSLRSRA